MIEAALLIPIAILGYLLHTTGKRVQAILDATRAEAHATRLAQDAERAEWGKERRQLLNRIQQPEKAVYEDFEPSQEVPYVGYDDDDAFWETKLNG